MRNRRLWIGLGLALAGLVSETARAFDEAVVGLYARFVDRDTRFVLSVGAQLGTVRDEEIGCALYLAHVSRRPVEEIVAMRRRGMAWLDILVALRLPVDVVVVAVDRDYGPPYGKAWGYWARRKKGQRVVLQLTDDEFVRFVNVKIAARVYGVPESAVVAELVQTPDFAVWVRAKEHGPGKGKGHGPPGKAKGKGKPHG